MFLAAFLSGCTSSILLPGGDITDMIPETTSAPETTKSEQELEEARREAAEKEEIEKYASVPGERAFYLLPAGIPWPGGMCSFTLLDVISGNTTVYAYQTLYDLSDRKGLGGMPENGKKGKDETVGKDFLRYLPESKGSKDIDGPMTSDLEMATIVMMYNFDTGEYRVLFHDLQDVKVVLTVADDAVEYKVQAGELVSDFGKLDLSQIKAARIAEGRYVFYYKEHVYTVSAEDGSVSELNIREDIRSLMKYCNDKKELLWHAEKIVTDENNEIYLLLQSADEEAMDYDSTKDVDKGKSSVKQYLLTLSVDKEKPVFQSDNLSFETQKAAFLAYDGKSVDFGECSEEPDKSKILKQIGSPEDILKKYNDQFYIWYKQSGSRNYLLYYYDKNNTKVYPVGDYYPAPGTDWYVRIEEKIGEKTAVADAYLGPQEKGIACTDTTETFERRVEIKYHTKREEKYYDDDGNEQTRIIIEDHSFEYTDGMQLIRCRNAVFPITGFHWFWHVPSARDIGNSPYTGVLDWLSTDPDPDNEKETGSADIRWDASGTPFFKIEEKEEDKKYGVSFQHPLKLTDMRFEPVDDSGNEFPVLYIDDTENIYVFYNFSKDLLTEKEDWADSFVIPKSELSIDQIKGNDGKPVISFTENSTLLRKENGSPWLYSASVTDGLTKLSLTVSGSARRLPGRVLGFPCLCVYPSGEKDTLLVFGFESEGSSFKEADLPYARVYKVDFYEEQILRNMIYFFVDRQENSSYTYELLSLTPSSPEYSSSWNAFYKSLGINPESISDPSALSGIRKDLAEQWSYVIEFTRLAKLQKVPDQAAIAYDIRKCESVGDLEQVFVKYTDLKVPEMDKPKPKEQAEAAKWEMDVRSAKLKKIKEIQDPAMTDEDWEEELREILIGLS